MPAAAPRQDDEREVQRARYMALQTITTPNDNLAVSLAEQPTLASAHLLQVTGPPVPCRRRSSLYVSHVTHLAQIEARASLFCIPNVRCK